MLLVSAPRVCPLVNLPSIKRADPTRYPRSCRKLALIQSLSDPGRMLEFTAIGRVLSTTINYHRFGRAYLLVVGRSERCSLLIALRGQRVQRALTGGGTPAETRRYIS